MQMYVEVGRRPKTLDQRDGAAKMFDMMVTIVNNWLFRIFAISFDVAHSR
jgi:hypothetical protein